MFTRSSSKLVLISIGCAAALIIVGAATALASRASVAVSAPAAKPAASVLSRFEAAAALFKSAPVVVAQRSIDGAEVAKATDAMREASVATEVREAVEMARVTQLGREAVEMGDQQEVALLKQESRSEAAAVAPAQLVVAVALVAAPEPVLEAAQAPEAPVAAAAVVVEPASEPESPESEHPAEVSFKGAVSELTGSDPNYSMKVGDVSVTTDGSTIIVTGTGDLVNGAWVEVEGFAQLDGSVLAKKVEVEHSGEPGDDDVAEVEFKAPIVSFVPAPYVGDWVIGDFTVTVVETTTIDTNDGLLAVGAIAEVKATQLADGTLRADEIKIENEDEFENEAEFKGVISELAGSAPDLTMKVNDVTVTTNAGTTIIGTLADGVMVEVHGSTQPDGSVRATEVKVEDDPGAPAADEKQFTAHIETINAETGIWTFDNGESVRVDATTLIDESNGLAEIGALVEVKAIKQGSEWVAVKIQVED